MAEERTLVLIRERSFLDVLDLSLVVAKSKPLGLALAAAAGVVPFEILNAYLLGESESLSPWSAVFRWLACVLLEAPLATAPLTVFLGGLMFGRRTSAVRIAATLGRQCVSLILYQGLIRGFLLVTLVASWVVPMSLLFVNEVILLERAPWTKVIGRCSRLSRGRGAELVGMMIAQFLFGTVFVLCFSRARRVLAGLLTSQFSWESANPDPTALPPWAFRLGVWLVISFFAISRFMTYIDQRIRLEGWEVALRLRAAGAAMEESERW